VVARFEKRRVLVVLSPKERSFFCALDLHGGHIQVRVNWCVDRCCLGKWVLVSLGSLLLGLLVLDLLLRLLNNLDLRLRLWSRDSSLRRLNLFVNALRFPAGKSMASRETVACQSIHGLALVLPLQIVDFPVFVEVNVKLQLRIVLHSRVFLLVESLDSVEDHRV